MSYCEFENQRIKYSCKLSYILRKKVLLWRYKQWQEVNHMSATTSELLDSYTKMLDSEFYKNLKDITAGIEALQKSLVGNDLHKQMQAWKTVLNDSESFINKSKRMWSEFFKNIDYGTLTGLQQFADQMPKIDMSSFVALQTHLGELLNTENIINFKLSEAIDYAYETAKEIEEPDIGKEELKNNIIEEIDNKDAKKSTIRNSEFQKTVCKMICIILLTACTYLYHAGGIENASVIDFVNYIMEYIVPSLLASGLCNNGNVITNTCIEKNDKQ